MTKLFNFLFEDKEQKRTKTKTKPKIDPNIFEPRVDQPLANIPKPEQPKSEPQAPEMKKASRGDTQRATSNITPTDQMRSMLSQLRNLQDLEDDDGYPEPETPDVPMVRVDTQNLPAVATSALLAADTVTPEFHQVSNLPGNMQRAIRQMGKQVFRLMTRTPVDEIYTVANLGGQGPNTPREVNAVAKWIVDNGEDLGDVEIDFSHFMPGYNPEQKLYKAAGIRWLLVRDFAGTYIYCWPDQQSIEMSNAPRLR